MATYFAKAWIGGNPIKLAKVTNMPSDIREKRLSLVYYVPFENPVRTDTEALTYSIYVP